MIKTTDGRDKPKRPRQRWIDEKDAWVLIAKAYDDPIDRSHLGYVCAEVVGVECIGICRAVLALHDAKLITNKVRISMAEKLKKEPRQEGMWCHIYQIDMAGAKKRADLCRRFAKEIRYNLT